MQRRTAPLFALLTLLALTAPATHAATATRTSAFEYDAATGLLIKEIVEPDNPALCLVTTYSYDAYGNKTGSTTRNCNGSSGEAAAPTGDAVFSSRSSSSSYAATPANPVAGQFPTAGSNALNHSETRDFDPRFGKPIKLTGPNNLATTWAYDGFGRKTREDRADGTWTTWSYEECDSSCPGVAQYFIVTLSPGAPESRVYHDRLNREVRSATVGFDGRWVYKDTEYNDRGLVARVSRPYYAEATPLWTVSYYDELGRPYQIDDADGGTTRIGYQGLTTVTTNPKGQSKTEVKNSQGQLVTVTDAAGYGTAYSYDAFGNLVQTRDPNGNLITNTYDLRGRKTAMNDPDMGAWSYAYNALGELVRQVDARSKTTTNTYDLLGRLVKRSEADLVTTWHYERYKDGSACALGVGKLCEVAADNKTGQRIFYDGYGRLTTVAHVIDTTYWAYRGYDAYGRIESQSVNTVFITRNIYNANGYLAELRRDADNGLLWRADAMDAEGHVTRETLGNGITTDRVYDPGSGRVTGIQSGPGGSVQSQAYVYDSLGNLTERSDTVLGNESFTYDDLNRLTSSSRDGYAITVEYDALGNITHKSDVGDYTYGSAFGTPRPHAVAQVGWNYYSYDANGNMTSSGGRSVTWTSYNLPKTVFDSGGYTTFLYDYNHVRAQQTNSGKTTIYLNPRIDLGGHYHKESDWAGSTESYYFYAGGRVVGAYITSTKSGVSPQTHYFHADHLGSISVVTDAAGQVVARYHYDAWGKRVLAEGADATMHGFTGHEHLDGGLIHMNGRVYDPLVGRFLSADPYIQDPFNLQSYNRYSYVLNNPLAFIDPSGYFSLKKFFIRVVAAVADIFGCSGYCSAAVNTALAAQQGGWRGALVSASNQYFGQGSLPAFAVRTAATCSNGEEGACLGRAVRQELISEVQNGVIEYARSSMPKSGPVICQHVVAGNGCGSSSYGPAVRHLGPVAVLVLGGAAEGGLWTGLRTAAIWGARAVGAALGITIANENASEDGTDSGVKIDDKIKGQLGDRGWTEQDVQEAANGSPAGTATDNRRPNKTVDGQGRNDSATVYGTRDGYIVVNDRTREVVQVSDRKRGAGWIPDSRIKWNEGN